MLKYASKNRKIRVIDQSESLLFDFDKRILDTIDHYTGVYRQQGEIQEVTSNAASAADAAVKADVDGKLGLKVKDKAKKGINHLSLSANLSS